MRIPGRKIHRAFPELDRFSDDQCARFVRAANRGFWWGSLRFVVWGATGGCILAAVVVGGSLLLGTWQTWLGEDLVEMLALLPPWLILLAVVPLLLLAARDWLLCRRVRSILATRGRCQGCGYGLLGLPVDEKLVVTCPECGAKTTVDRSLGELTVDAQGNTRFQPSSDAMRTHQIFWTATRRKWGIRAGIAATILFVVLPGGALGVHEILLMQQATEARADRQRFRAEWEAHVEASQPAGSSASDPDAWTVFESIEAKHDVAYRVLMQRDPDRNPTGAVPLPDLIYHPPSPPVDLGDPVAYQNLQARYREDMKSRELALDLMEQLRRDGVFLEMAEMATMRRTVPHLPVDWTRPLSDLMAPMLGKCRAILRINTARMYLAQLSGDDEEFLRATEANLALVRLARSGPTVIWQLVADAIQDVTFAQCRRYFAMGAPAPLAGKLLEMMQRQRSEADYAYGIAGDRLSTNDTIAWLFSEPSRVRYGLRSQAVASYIGNAAFSAKLAGNASSIVPTLHPGLKSYSDNRDASDACFNEAAAHVKQECWERAAATANANEYPLVDAFLIGFTQIMGANDHAILNRRAFELLLRIEAFRAEHGSLPVIPTTERTK